MRSSRAPNKKVLLGVLERRYKDMLILGMARTPSSQNAKHYGMLNVINLMPPLSF